MAKRKLAALAVAALGLAAFTACGTKSTTPPASTGGGTQAPTTVTTVPSSGGHSGYGNGY